MLVYSDFELVFCINNNGCQEMWLVFLIFGYGMAMVSENVTNLQSLKYVRCRNS